MNTIERFNKFFKKTDGCWIWEGALLNNRPIFWLNGKSTSAQRVAWMLHFRKQIPDKQRVLRNCKCNLCVNPRHLYIGKGISLVGIKESFLSKIKKTSYCWEWIGVKDRNGYGRFSHSRKNLAHRFSYELNNGKIPKGFFVCHKCDNPSCVKPSHLFVGTQLDNMQDASKKGRCNPLRGEKSPCSKFTNEQIIEMRRLYDKREMNQSQIGRLFGIGSSYARKIVLRQRWKHI